MCEHQTYLHITSFSDSGIIGAAEEIIGSPGDFDLPETAGVTLERDLWPAWRLDWFLAKGPRGI